MRRKSFQKGVHFFRLVIGAGEKCLGSNKTFLFLITFGYKTLLGSKVVHTIPFSRWVTMVDSLLEDIVSVEMVNFLIWVCLSVFTVIAGSFDLLFKFFMCVVEQVLLSCCLRLIMAFDLWNIYNFMCLKMIHLWLKIVKHKGTLACSGYTQISVSFIHIQVVKRMAQELF